jgi:uncharacterized membrane protein
MRWLRSNWLYFVLTLAVAFAVHVASVAFLPQLVMTRALARISGLNGYNTMTHQPRATSAARAVVRPSPDLLYSACAFDLNQTPGGVLHVHTKDMPDSYWSISVFDAETNNVFVLNSNTTKARSADFLIVYGEGDAVTGGSKLPEVWMPTARGLVLVRALIDDDKHLAAIDAARRHAVCEPFKLGNTP